MKQSLKHHLCRAVWLLAAVCGSTAVAAPAGALDPTFGNGTGVQTIHFDLGGDLWDSAQAMIKGPGGTLYLIGDVASDDGDGIGLTRLRHDGQIDESFGTSGRAFHKEPLYSSMYVKDAALQGDGRIVVVGWRYVSQPYSRQMLACRFEASGAIDVSFGHPQTPGCRAIPSPVGNQDEARSVLIQPDGRIVLAGYAIDWGKGLNRAVAVRLLPNGYPDASFGNQGVFAAGYRIMWPEDNVNHTWLNDVARTPVGNLVFTGWFRNGGNSDVLVVQLQEADGAFDETFNGSGYKTVVFDLGGDLYESGRAVQVLPDGAVLVTGDVAVGVSKVVPFAMKLDAVGAPYPGFGVDGTQILNTCSGSPCDMTPVDLQVTDSGQILLAGTAYRDGLDEDFFVMRLNPDGERDGTFGPGGGLDDGVAYVDIAVKDDRAYRVLPQGERVLVAGDTHYAGDDRDFAIARLDHGIDETFTVTPNPGPGGSMSPDADQIVKHSDQVDVLVTAEPGFTLVQVTGCGVTTVIEGVYTTAPVTADCIVTAEFSPDLVVRYSAGPNGSIVGESPQIVVFGGNAQAVEAIGATGYHFAQWDDGVLDNPRQDSNVTQNIDVTALFDVNLYTVVPNPGPNGTLSPDDMQWVPHGGTTQFIVQPDPGFAIGEFSNCTGTLQGNVFTTAAIFDGCKVNVTFVASNQMLALHYLTDGNGTLTGETQQSVLSGADGSPVTAVPKPGYQFVAWSDGHTDNPRQDTHVVADIEVTAIFAAGEAPGDAIFSDGFEGAP